LVETIEKVFSCHQKLRLFHIISRPKSTKSPAPEARYVLRAASCWHLAGSARDVFSNLIKTTMRKQ